MASAAVREELNCSICLEVYTDPVTLRCGHNFCRACIEDVLQSQRSQGGFSCPQCRTRFKRRPFLQKNITLANIAEHFRSASPRPKENGTFCTYCIHAPVLAVKSCLHCEASLCGDHLHVHSKSPEHILIEPSNSLEDWKCSVHKKVLEYYCTVDCSILCVLCMQEATHQGHAVQTVSEASRNKMEKVKSVLTQLIAKRRENEATMKTLQKRGDKASSAGVRLVQSVASLFHEIREKLNILEVQTTEHITQQIKSKTKAIYEQTDLLEIKNHIISLNIGPMQDFCQLTDPMAILKDRQWNIGEVSEKRGDGATPEAESLDEVLFALQIQKDLTEILSFSPTVLDIPRLSNLSFNSRTAAPSVTLSQDLTVAGGSIVGSEDKDGDDGPDSRWVFSITDFLFGRHYWEVELSRTGSWRVGMAYKDMCEDMEKSWCLCKEQQGYFFRHGDNPASLPGPDDGITRLGIYVDFDEGRISFYNMDPEVRHVHTVCTTFTEPLYAAVWVGPGAWVKIIR